MKLEFVGQSARDADNVTANPSRLINGFREPMVPGGRAATVIRAVPGMKLLYAAPTLFTRALGTYDGALLAVMGSRLYRITEDGAATDLGSVAAQDDIAGITVSTGIAAIVAGRQYWTWDGTTLSAVATGEVTSPASVAYLGGYVLVSQYGGRVFAWSGLVDPASWNGLDFATAEVTDDPIIRLVAFKEALLVFKASGFEQWAVSGLSGPDAFVRVDGAQNEPGLAAYGLLATFPNGFAYVGSDNRVHVSGAGPVSTPPVETAIATAGPERMFYYALRGHGFVCLVFRDAPAWCLDLATLEWHERAENEGPWTARDSVSLGKKWLVGTQTGKIAELVPECVDFGAPMVRRYVSRTLDPLRRVRVRSIEAFPRISGDIQGLGDGSPAAIDLRTSRDGILFGPPKRRSVGTVGAYAQRLVWRELGQFRTVTVELSQSSATDVPLLAEIDAMVE